MRTLSPFPPSESQTSFDWQTHRSLSRNNAKRLSLRLSRERRQHSLSANIPWPQACEGEGKEEWEEKGKNGERERGERGEENRERGGDWKRGKERERKGERGKEDFPLMAAQWSAVHPSSSWMSTFTPLLLIWFFTSPRLPADAAVCNSHRKPQRLVTLEALKLKVREREARIGWEWEAKRERERERRGCAFEQECCADGNPYRGLRTHDFVSLFFSIFIYLYLIWSYLSVISK